MIANVLQGKELEIFDSLTVDDLNACEYFKSAVLKAYELRSEAYRLSFRNVRKRAKDTYVEYAL